MSSHSYTDFASYIEAFDRRLRELNVRASDRAKLVLELEKELNLLVDRTLFSTYDLPEHLASARAAPYLNVRTDDVPLVSETSERRKSRHPFLKVVFGLVAAGLVFALISGALLYGCVRRVFSPADEQAANPRAAMPGIIAGEDDESGEPRFDFSMESTQISISPEGMIFTGSSNQILKGQDPVFEVQAEQGDFYFTPTNESKVEWKCILKEANAIPTKRIEGDSGNHLIVDFQNSGDSLCQIAVPREVLLKANVKSGSIQLKAIETPTDLTIGEGMLVVEVNSKAKPKPEVEVKNGKNELAALKDGEVTLKASIKKGDARVVDKVEIPATLQE
jgi:hypothetical protein